MSTAETTRTSVGTHAPSFGEFFKVWLKIGCINFGGPAGQIAMMHRIVVDEKKWVEEQRFLHALNFCMLLPGPEAQKLATYIGWLLHGTRGGIAAGAPEVFTTVMGASNRKRRIFIDFHRNARSATAVAPYSLRARNNLPASAPLSWEDLEKVDAPEDLNYASLPGLVAASGDPWADIGDFARDLPRA